MGQLTLSHVDSPVPTPPQQAWRTLAISSLAVLATFVDTTALFIAFPDIGRSFPIGPSSLSWVLNGYTIAFAALLVPAGKLADRVGHKRAFLAGSALFTVASLLCAMAPNAGALVGFRLLQAAGAAALIPSSLALILRAFPRERIPVAIAIWGATGAVAGAIGSTLGAVLVEAAGWRWVFLVNLPVGVVTVAAGLRWLNEARDQATRVPSPLAVMLIAAGAALISLGVVRTDEWGWADRRTLSSIVGGTGVLVVFILTQRKAKAPAMDLDLFASHNYRWANLATVTFAVGFSAVIFGSVAFLTGVWGWSVLAAGLGVSPGPLLVAVLAPVFGRLATRTGQRPLVLVGAAAFSVGAALRLFFLEGSPSYVDVFLPSMLLLGLGIALCLPQLSSAVAQSLPPNRFGVGTAANQALRLFGFTFGVALAVAFSGTPTSTASALAGFDQVWWLAMTGGLVTAALAVRLRTRTGVEPASRPTPASDRCRPVCGDSRVDSKSRCGRRRGLQEG